MAFVTSAAAVRLSAARSAFVCRAAGVARAAVRPARVAVPATRSLSMEASPTVTNTVYFDITIGGEPQGRVTFGLFGDEVYVSGFFFFSCRGECRPEGCGRGVLTGGEKGGAVL